MDYIGRTVAKKFPGYGNTKFKGRVTAVIEDEGEQYFTIRYEDEDEEEVELKELKRILQPEPTTASKRKATAAPDGAEASKPDTAAAGGGRPKRGKTGDAAPSGKGKSKAAAQPVSPPTELPRSVDEAQLRGMVDEVAATSKALEVNLVRYPHPERRPAGPQASRAVTCGGMCYTSSIMPAAANQLAEGVSADILAKEYEAQAADVLGQLEAVLEEAGSSKEHLVSVTVLLQDAAAGSKGFAAAWGRFISPHALPALVTHESFLGSERLLVGVSAVAAVPSGRYA